MFLCALPLFLSSFMHQYIFNSPKYAIEEALTKTDQAHYGYLVMPVFVINLLSLFVFRPQLITLSSDWAEKRFKSQSTNKGFFRGSGSLHNICHSRELQKVATLYKLSAEYSSALNYFKQVKWPAPRPSPTTSLFYQF